MSSEKTTRRVIKADPNIEAECRLVLTIAGKTLIQEKLPEKLYDEFRRKHMGEEVGPKPNKNPIQNAKDLVYWVGKQPKLKEERYDSTKLEFPIVKKNTEKLVVGFPASAIKSATKRAVKLISDIKMVDANNMFWVDPSDYDHPEVRRHGLFLIDFESFDIREDIVPVGRNVPDLRHRFQFNDWTAEINIRYNSRLVRPETLVEWIRAAGYMVGIGAWRPCTKNGNSGPHGVFEIVKAVAYTKERPKERAKKPVVPAEKARTGRKASQEKNVKRRKVKVV